ncbi:Hypothetical protein CINCED_3A004956 [Cinara cedri]|uniref:Uncharacterized protein n=1 Tax=Cinara cedri TaxID=506608 RepID=A0A5E4MLE1_9HEMI|nr:Hypothetical protein CINCED_3A004956 [Cinara cedri]
MVDTVEQEVVAGKSILKRRIRNNTSHININSNTAVSNNNNNERSAEEPAPKRDNDNCAENIISKRNVTFNDTISVKNDKDLVIKKPLKLELVIENWKSSNAKTLPEIVQPDPGIVRRLVDEFNTIEDPLTDNPEIDSALSEAVKEVNEDESTEIQMDIPLCEALETVNLTTDDRVVTNETRVEQNNNKI